MKVSQANEEGSSAAQDHYGDVCLALALQRWRGPLTATDVRMRALRQRQNGYLAWLAKGGFQRVEDAL
ncbi:hypothetical protein [Massilia sp. TS11]|uniref:hypothetical protein n=1 Tax=Massilia sp. TS11 TaxID=2908003 RepID=UPI001EDA7AF1|nr:hypothetical protein [Massilia sp. TS11]MCG2582816.1 hypothetical protein [Massilia sp. TS11]